MNYVDSVLTTGEEVLHTMRFHWLDKLWAFVLCFIVIGIFAVIRMWTTEVAVTNRRLIYKTGWIARKAEEISLRRIEEVNMKQSVLGRLLGYGRIWIRGTGGGDIVLPNMDDPMQLKQELQEAQAQYELRNRESD